MSTALKNSFCGSNFYWFIDGTFLSSKLLQYGSPIYFKPPSSSIIKVIEGTLRRKRWGMAAVFFSLEIRPELETFWRHISLLVTFLPGVPWLIHCTNATNPEWKKIIKYESVLKSLPRPMQSYNDVEKKIEGSLAHELFKPKGSNAMIPSKK